MPQHARLIGVLLAALVVAATAALAAVAAPARHAGGTLSFCSDITYPPEEFYVGSKPAGSDIDIGTAVARQLGMKASFTNTGFDGIIAALQAKKCDAIISGMNDTPARAKQVSFVDYISVGQSVMVKAGNPKHLSNLASLAGKTVSVEVGTTNKDFLDAESKKLQKEGKSAIKVQSFPKDTDAAAALKAGRVDAYFGDSPVVAYYIQKDSSFAFAGAPVNPIPVGIALRKHDTNEPAVRKAIKTLYANGTMKRILAKWHMSAFALKK
jgi:polar amino acid transport system substrate-binding protein